MTPPVRLRLRLAAWYVVCAALLLGHVVWFLALRRASAEHQRNVQLIGQIALGTLIIVLAILLATTPPDAIRLPRRRSEILILAGTVWLLLSAHIILAPSPLAIHLWATIVTLLAALLLLGVLRARKRSAWIAALFTWNPVVIVASVSGHMTGAAIAFAIVAVVACWRGFR